VINSFKNQIRNNSVALISLVIAVSIILATLE
jgi:hypothetical protein